MKRTLIIPFAATLILFAPAAHAFWGSGESTKTANSGGKHSWEEYTTDVEGLFGKDQELYSETHGVDDQRKVENMGQLAAESYKDGTAAVPDGYTPVTDVATLEKYLGANSGFTVAPDGTITSTGEQAGFQAALYIGPDGPVLAFRGTEFTREPRLDNLANAQQAKNRQYQYASQILGALLANYPGHVDVTGHSLGGGLTQYAMATNNLEGRVSGYTFNSAGLFEETLNGLDDDLARAAAAAMTNVRSRGDTVSSGAGRHLGEVYDYANSDFKAHNIGKIIGYDENGKPVYDGFLGRIQRDRWNAEHPDKPIKSSEDLVKYKNPDDIIWWNVREEANKLFQECMPLLGRTINRDGACLCGDAEAQFDAAEKARMEFGMFLSGYLETYGRTNPWLPIALTSKFIGDTSAIVFKYLEKKWFGTSWGSEALGVINSAIENYGEGSKAGDAIGDAVVEDLAGDPIALGESLAKCVQDLEKFSFSNIDSLDTAVDMLENILKIKGQIDNHIRALERLGLKKEASKKLQKILDKIDMVCDALNTVIDAYKAAKASVGYFQGISDTREAMKELIKRKAEYEKLSAKFADLGKCHCGDECECQHCKKEKGQKDDNPPDGTNPSTGGGTNPGTGGGTNPGTGGGTNPGTGEVPSPTPGGGASRFIHDPGKETENPWDRIFGGITGNGKADSGGSSLLDIVGMGDFSKMLDSLSDVAEIAGSLSTVSQLAGGIWGAASGIGTERIQELEDFIAFNVNQIVNSFVAKVSGKIGDWINNRLSSISDLIEKYTGPANEWLDKMGGKIDKWLNLGLDVSKSIDAMAAYVESLGYTRVSAPRLTVVDYGIDAEIKVDTTGNSQRKRTIHQRYSEDVK